MLSSKGKKAIIAIVTLIVLAIGAAIYFEINQLRFSIEPGVYDEDIELDVSGGFLGRVYYTLDGTDPLKENGQVFKGPIKLTDATELDNRESMRTDSSVGFDTKMMKALGDKIPGYAAPDYNIDKGYYVRVAYRNFLGLNTQNLEGMYLVNLDEKKIYDNVCIISITTDSKNLWDYENGIYCTGRDYDEFKEKLATDPDTKKNPGPWDFRPANYTRDDELVERPCHLEVYDEAHKLIERCDCGLKLQGNASKRENQKAFMVTARQEYSGSEYFSADLSNSGYARHKYIFSAGGEDQCTKAKDYIMANNTIADLDLATMDFRPAMLFLNGEYWGFYFICESFNDDFLLNHYGVAKENGIIYKNGFVNEGLPEDAKLYDEMTDYITTHDMTNLDNYAKACELIDMNSFIDYYCFMYYICRNGDWPYGNEACWRVRNPSGRNFYDDGRWRWMVFDLNSENGAMCLKDVENYKAPIDQAMWLKLYKNDFFRKAFSKRLVELSEVYLEPDKMDSLIDEYYSTYKPCLESSNKRFYGDERLEQMDREIADLNKFFRKRQKRVENIICYNFGTRYWKELKE